MPYCGDIYSITIKEIKLVQWRNYMNVTIISVIIPCEFTHDINILKVFAVTLFRAQVRYPEDGCSKFLQNAAVLYSVTVFTAVETSHLSKLPFPNSLCGGYMDDLLLLRTEKIN